MIKTIKLAVVLSLCATLSGAATIAVATRDGNTTNVTATTSTLKKKVVVLNDGTRLDYSQVDTIATDDFDTYEKAVKRAARKGNEHITVKYIGERNVDALRLAKLEKKRKGAGAARGADGIMMLLGVLSGSRELATAGVATYGVGTVVKDVNTDRTIRAQNDVIVNLQENQKKLSEADSLEAQYRIEYGDENVDGIIALVDSNHKRALTFAEVGEISDDEYHQFSAVWLKAIVYADQGDQAALDTEIERILEIDPEVNTEEEAVRWINLLLSDLEEIHKS